MDYYTGPERRENLPLSEQQIETIAEKAAEKAVKKMTDDVYRTVGKGVISKFLWITGALAVGFYAWFKSKGLV